MAAKTNTNDHATSLSSLAARFPQYAELPTNARYLFALACRAGLAIEHNGANWTWTGTVQQHRASGLWPQSLDWSFKSHRWVCTSEGLRADLIRDKSDAKLIRAVHKMFYSLSGDRRVFKTVLTRGEADRSHKRFVDRLLVPVDCSGDEVPQPSPRPVLANGAETAPQTAPASTQIDLDFLSGYLGSGPKGISGAVVIAARKGGGVDVRIGGVDPRFALRLLGMAEVLIEAMKNGNQAPHDDEDA